MNSRSTLQIYFFFLFPSWVKFSSYARCPGPEKFSKYSLKNDTRAAPQEDFFCSFILHNRLCYMVVSHSMVFLITALYLIDPKNGRNFLACVSDKPLIHNIQKWCELTAFLTVTVNTIIDCYKSNFLFSKENISDKTYLQIQAVISPLFFKITGVRC